MQEAKVGLRARIHYTAKLKNGKIVGSSRGGQPLSFTIGRVGVDEIEKKG